MPPRPLMMMLEWIGIILNMSIQILYMSLQTQDTN
jgi:hypothetical protein